MEIIRLTKEMFESGRCFAQGELRIWMKGYEPQEIKYDTKNLKEVMPENGRLIVAHSESGHHHAIDVLERPETFYSRTAQRLIDSTNDLIAELRINEESKLVHHRQNEQHKTYILPIGTYVCRIDTEFLNDAYRKVAD
jgi:hypothetical protein